MSQNKVENLVIVAKTLRTINLLLEKNLIKKIGQGPGTKYAVNE